MIHTWQIIFWSFGSTFGILGYVVGVVAFFRTRRR